MAEKNIGSISIASHILQFEDPKDTEQPIPSSFTRNTASPIAISVTNIRKTTTTPIHTSSTPTIAVSTSPTPTRFWDPPKTSDLLFLSEERLMRWDHITNFATVLVENVISFAASKNGKTIILIQPQPITGNGVERFKLSLLDLESKQMSTLFPSTPRLYNLAVSPDGAWLAYTQSDQGGMVYALNLGKDFEGLSVTPITVGRCLSTLQFPCTGFYWSPDGLSLLWADRQGVWISELKPNHPRLSHNGVLKISDPKGQSSELNVQFVSPIWSPSGRFVLVTIKPINSDVRWQALLDTKSGRITSIADTYTNSSIDQKAEWSGDGNLVVFSSGDKPGQNHSIKILKVLATSPNLLFPIKNVSILDPNHSYSKTIPCRISELDEQRFVICMKSESGSKHLIAIVTLKNGSVKKTVEFPFEPVRIEVSPDRQGLIIVGAEGNSRYINLNTGEVIDLLSILGESVHSFSWMPPAPRNKPASQSTP